MDWLKFERPISDIYPQIVFAIGDFRIANTTLYLFFIALVLLIVFAVLRNRLQLIPTNFQAFIEIVYEGLLSFLQQITGSRYHAERVFMIVGSLFVFIFLANFSGLIPGLTSITWDDVMIFRTPTADFNTTLALSVGSIIALQGVSMIEWGFFAHWGKYFKFKEVFQGFQKGIGQGSMALVDFFIGLLDIIGEFAKVISLSLRLFGNMYAGEVLMTILIGSFAYMIPSLWLAMSLLSAVVQAVVFGSLVTVFYMLAINPARHRE